MIITRTPFRVSFVGGGTDIKDFYRVESGAVISTAIKKYMYITVNQRFDNTIRISYSKTEIVSKVTDIQHPIVREALKLAEIDRGIEIVSIADIPSGTGLGSSSSFTVGLLNALYAYKGILKSAEDLAAEACRIEIEILGEPIGKQDQYIAAFGGIRYFQFNPDESVYVNPILLHKETRQYLEDNCILLYTGDSRDANTILIEQKNNMRQENKFHNLQKIRQLTVEAQHCLLNNFSLVDFGNILHQGWMIKRGLAGGVSNRIIDSYYENALNAGAIGGKLLGAGGGGFLLLVCLPDTRRSVRQALGNLQEMDFSLEPEGSKIIYII